MKSVLLMLAFVLACLTTPVTMVAQDSEARHLYDSLRTRLEAGDTLIDYHKFRMAYTETDLYNPHDTREAEHAMFDAMDNGNWKEAIEHGLQALAENYTSMSVHYGIGYAYEQNDQHELSNLHQTIGRRLLRAITHTGDGETPETAWRVISVNEEYFILNVLGMDFKRQSLLRSKEGEPIDKMEVVDSESGEEHTYYFNVSLSFGYLRRLRERK